MLKPLENELNVLSHISLFQGIAEDEFCRITSVLERRTFGRKEVIYHKQDRPTGLYILVKGEARTRIVLPDDRQITFHIFHAGNYFGLHSLLDEQERTTDAVAVTVCHTLFFPCDEFLAFLDRHPPATHELLRVMARMYRSAAQRMQDLALLDVRSRIAKELVHLAAVRHSVSEDHVCLELSQSELASLVGATRESTNKWLRFFEQEGWIELSRGNIHVLRLDALADRTSVA